MSLSTELHEGGDAAGSARHRVTLVMDEVEGVGHRVVSSHVDVRGRVPGADEAAFQQAAEAADAGCAFSALIKASATVTFEAALEPG